MAPVTTPPSPPTKPHEAQSVPPSKTLALESSKPSKSEAKQRSTKGPLPSPPLDDTSESEGAATPVRPPTKSRAAMPGIKLDSAKKDDPSPAASSSSTTTAVRRSCHKCQSKQFKDDKCRQCEHTYCQKCRDVSQASKNSSLSKQPSHSKSKSTDTSREYPSTRLESATKVASLLRKRSSVGLLKVTSTPRICHHCDAKFSLHEGMCRSCHHVMCGKCPQDRSAPVDKSADPLRPRIQNTTRQRVRYTCDHCEALFDEQSRTCGSCGHGLCRQCRREPPKRVCHRDSSETRSGGKGKRAEKITTGKPTAQKGSDDESVPKKVEEKHVPEPIAAA